MFTYYNDDDNAAPKFIKLDMVGLAAENGGEFLLDCKVEDVMVYTKDE